MPLVQVPVSCGSGGMWMVPWVNRLWVCAAYRAVCSMGPSLSALNLAQMCLPRLQPVWDGTAFQIKESPFQGWCLGSECLLLWPKVCWRPSWYWKAWAGYWVQTASQDGNWMLWKPLIFTSPWQLRADLQLTLKMNPAWKDSASTQPIVATTFPSCTIPRRIKDPGRFFCLKQSHIIHSAGLKFCLPALVLSETQMNQPLLCHRAEPASKYSQQFVLSPLELNAFRQWGQFRAEPILCLSWRSQSWIIRA